MDKLKKKAQLLLDRAEKSDSWPKDLDYKKAMCLVCLEEYGQAKAFFNSSYVAYREQPRLWATTNEPDIFVNVTLLSGYFDFAAIIHPDLKTYIETRGELYYPDYYSLIIKSFAESSRKEGINSWITKLLEKTSVKEGYEIGRIARSIVDNDQAKFDSSLHGLLNIYSRAARYGGLRETSEGLFSLNAMTLAFFARKSGLDINRGSFFLPIDYLDFLLENKK